MREIVTFSGIPEKFFLAWGINNITGEIILLQDFLRDLEMICDNFDIPQQFLPQDMYLPINLVLISPDSPHSLPRINLRKADYRIVDREYSRVPHRISVVAADVNYGLVEAHERVEGEIGEIKNLGIYPVAGILSVDSPPDSDVFRAIEDLYMSKYDIKHIAPRPGTTSPKLYEALELRV